ncbi:hypothetical protein KJ742_01405 [Patescibacteria group bacterium]|nr:hypothetical protein [Patescibacteria group bacterium]
MNRFFKKVVVPVPTAIYLPITSFGSTFLCIFLITLFFSVNYSYAEDVAYELTSTSQCLGESYLNESTELDEIEGGVVIKNRLQGPRSHGFTEAESLIAFVVPKKDTHILGELDNFNSADMYSHYASTTGKYSLQIISVNISANDLIYGISKEEFESLFNTNVCLITALKNKVTEKISDEEYSPPDSMFLYMNGIYKGEDKESDVDKDEKNSFFQYLDKYKEKEAEWDEEYFVYTGVVKTDDDIFTVTDRLNNFYGTFYTYEEIAEINDIENYNDIDLGDNIKIGTLDGWQPPEDPDEVTVDYWEDLTMDKQKILHYHRNAYQFGHLPATQNALETEEWGECLDGEAIAHNVGTTGNIDCRGKGDNKGQQAVYDEDGNLVTTAENMGTYDFEPPALLNNIYRDHADVDVDPWIIWGNSPQDSTTMQERICAMSESLEGKASLIYLKYNYDHCE